MGSQSSKYSNSGRKGSINVKKLLPQSSKPRVSTPPANPAIVLTQAHSPPLPSSRTIGLLANGQRDLSYTSAIDQSRSDAFTASAPEPQTITGSTIDNTATPPSSAALSTQSQVHSSSAASSPAHATIPYAQSPAPSVTGIASAGTVSTSVAVSGTVDGPHTGETAKKVAKHAWTGLKQGLMVLNGAADVLPPLKAAVGGFLACVDIVETAFANRDDYKKLAEHLGHMSQTISESLGPEESPSVARIIKSIKHEVSRINEKLEHKIGRRILESTEDKDDVLKCYRNVDMLFQQLSSDVNLRMLGYTKEIKEQVETMLLRDISPVTAARYNSYYQHTIKRRRCTSETRAQVQKELREWAQDPDAPKVYWMNGMAGTGKTTIAYSFCEWLEKEEMLLGASFFCSRASRECCELKGIVPTIAYQLAGYSLAYRAALFKVLKDNQDVGALNVEAQFAKLVEEPLAAVADAMPHDVIVIVDALDECEDIEGVQEILESLLRFAGSLPLKFFVTSRPEPAILAKMEFPSQDRSLPSVFRLHDIERSFVEKDIEIYMTESFSSMSNPPPPTEIKRLAKQAGSLFIYAATIIRYITSSPLNSSKRLRALLNSTPQLSGNSIMHDVLNDLYTAILDVGFDPKESEPDEIENRRRVLWTAVCVIEPMTLATASLVLDLSTDELLSALAPLRSVLHVSEANDVISTLHASFPDYLLDPLRSNKFYCDRMEHNELLARRCFDVMKKELRFNICGLESSFVQDEDVPDLEERVKQKIASGLFYACQYWGEHLNRARDSEEVREGLGEFLLRRLLFWMEVLNLEECVGEGPLVLSQAQNWLSANNSTDDTVQYTSDAHIFVTQFAGSAGSRSTPHLYLSALAFCPKSNSVYRHYWPLIKGVRDMNGTMMNEREQAALAVWSVGSEVNSTAFSPNGTCIVSGSKDKTIRVWNALTGEPVGRPFQGHTDYVRSVAFSPDGTRIVSGSYDNTIRVWNALTGEPVGRPFQGHTSIVFSVAFSPDGTCIVSGSYDNTIRVWNALTDEPVGRPFQGHTSYVRSVAFSSDGTRIVSGSHDKTIRVWNALTGEPVGRPFQGHTSIVFSVAFSPDGTRIVSGSGDKTIRVWNALTGEPVGRPFQGHTSIVYSVAFSPDGTRIVSGSSDKTIRVWNALTGEPVGRPFQGHTSSVNSVAFSPDSTRIVSGSSDKTIRVWNALTGEPVGRSFEGHTSIIYSVAFSPDGIRIVSGSNDSTIRVWNALTGEPVGRPFQSHTDYVRSVAFSPDGTRIVSGSFDKTIRVWNALTGEPVGRPLKGHTSIVFSVAFSPDGTRIVSGSFDKTIRVWNALTGEPVGRPFEGHASSVDSVAFSPDGTRIVSGSGDKTIRVWNALMNQFSPNNSRNQHDYYFNHKWTLNPDGWITTTNNALLFWTPPDLHKYLPNSSTTLVITPTGTISINYSDIVFGNRWVECWRGE